MKFIRKYLLLAVASFTLVILLNAVSALADHTGTWMISIKKSSVRTNEIEKVIDALNSEQVGLSGCYVSTRVEKYVSYDFVSSSRYHGVAFVQLTSNCNAELLRRIWVIQGDPRYFVYLGGDIGTSFPAVGGGN